MYISHLFVVTFYSNLFPPRSFSYISDDRGRRSFLSLVARIALLSESCSTEDQIEETIVWFLTLNPFGSVNFLKGEQIENSRSSPMAWPQAQPLSLAESNSDKCLRQNYIPLPLQRAWIHWARDLQLRSNASGPVLLRVERLLMTLDNATYLPWEGVFELKTGFRLGQTFSPTALTHVILRTSPPLSGVV
jgi:hypothetical protein